MKNTSGTKLTALTASLAIVFSLSLVAPSDSAGARKPRPSKAVLPVETTAARVGDTINIKLEGKHFVPTEATVKDGDTVRICNADTFYHSLFSYSKYNQFGKPTGVRLRPEECMERVIRNPTTGNISVAIFDEIHSYEKLSLTVKPGESGLSGSWRIVQTADNGARYTGTLRLHQEGDRLSGRAEWDNHTQGSISGEIQEGRIKFTVEYAEGLVGTYQADLNSEGNQMINGHARSNKSEAVVKWQASRQ